MPTMGALHEGHLALVRQAAASADKVVVSIFVNPAQFAPQEDFGRYPRTLDSDSEKLERTGAVQLIYAPKAGDIYPEGFATKVSVEGPASGLETDFRPHFFSGVATVVAKLFVQCRPDIAVFGEKDYQQLLVVRRLSRDLDLGVDVLGVPTVREADGLALSSRNAYLTPESRKVAAQLNRVLLDVAERARAGVPVPQAEAEGAAALIKARVRPRRLCRNPRCGDACSAAGDQRPGAGARRRAHRIDPPDRQSASLDQSERRQFGVEGFGQLGHLAAPPEIVRRILRIEVAPALECAMEPAFCGHQVLVEARARNGARRCE